MLNHVILIGRLTADPELRYTNSGTAVCTFTLAVDRFHKNAQGESGVDFIPIVVWQKQAEVCAQYLTKGRLAAVDGRLQIRTYENRDGVKVKKAEIVANSVRFLDRASTSISQSNYPNQPAPANLGTESSKPKFGQDSSSSTNDSNSGRRDFSDDPFADDPFEGEGQLVDISEEDLPF